MLILFLICIISMVCCGLFICFRCVISVVKVCWLVFSVLVLNGDR